MDFKVADDNPLPIREVDNSGTQIAIAALAITVVALVTAVVQLLQTVIAAARSLPNCDSRAIGKWARFTRRRLLWRQMRLEIDFVAPVIFLAPNDNPKGPVDDPTVPIFYANGSISSCEDFHIDPPPGAGVHGYGAAVMGGSTRGPGMPTSTTDNELASWIRLLRMVQKMERDSNNWDRGRWPVGGLRQEELRLSLAVGVQAKTRTFDTNPSSVRKPYATTTLSAVVEIAAMLGLYWKEFDRDGNKYRAEGNGHSLQGTRHDGFGLVFVFETFGAARFERTRIIPTSEVQELCFGNMPTLYRPRTDDNHWKQPFGKQEELQTLQLGSRWETANTLSLIGCNTTTVLYFLREQHKHIHLFSVAFEVLGMLGRTLHVRGRCFTYLPNPSIFSWDSQVFSLRRLLAEFHRHTEKSITAFTLMECLRDLDATLPQGRDSGYSPHELDLLHDALDRCDAQLGADDGDQGRRAVVLDVVRRHLQEVLFAINTQTDEMSASPVIMVADVISFDDLLHSPPRYRERVLMDIYFNRIRPCATRADPASVPIHQQQDGVQEMETHSGSGAKWRDDPRDNIWCTLVFRMLVWLLLHDFDERDVQISKSELLGNQLRVYIV